MRPLPSSTPQPSDRLSASLFDLPGARQPELDDASLLSLLMTRTLPQRDIPRVVETLLKVFGSVAAVVAADPPELARAASLNATTITDLKLLQQLSVRLARSEACRRPVVSSWSCLIAYVRSALAHAPREQFRALYLDRKNVLLRDEFLAEGTVDHAPVYPREVIRRALEVSASALILVHNHPSGDPTPSRADIEMTRQINDARVFGLQVHDHLVIGRQGTASFKQLGLI
ncbi:MAG: DNA repair protein RadC [Brevundimonas sp.]|uniref:RadC family protein n=1 Tax=Brevundimonas sp. TaxID=1871086 RepID=UPI00271AEA9C|nr:DNA repair protein RadC [Brevundimonas sp.]MDO9608418.1 DNA repair protein RadC [Brevundimonas sp.]